MQTEQILSKENLWAKVTFTIKTENFKKLEKLKDKMLVSRIEDNKEIFKVKVILMNEEVVDCLKENKEYLEDLTIC